MQEGWNCKEMDEGKKDMLYYVQDVRAMRETGRGLSDHHIVLCKVRLVDTWIKRREVVNEAKRIINEKLGEHQNIEGYVRYLKSKRVEWDEGRNFEQTRELSETGNR